MAKDIREQLLKSFRAELAEHIQTMTTGLLAMEQATAQGAAADQEMLNTTFRAAHSLKGAARAMGVTAIEQLAHALENILDGLRRSTMTPTAEMYTACYHGLDAIQGVQTAYEAGETTPPVQSLLALGELEKIRLAASQPAPVETPKPAEAAVPAGEPPAAGSVAQAPAVSSSPASAAPAVDAVSAQTGAPSAGKEAASAVPAASVVAQQPAPVQAQPVHQPSAPAEQAVEQAPAAVPQSAAPSSGDETIRVDVQKLDALMANLSELLVARIRLEQRHEQIRQLQSQLNRLQRSWSPVRGPFNRLLRQQENGLLSLHRPRSVDAFVHPDSPGGNGSRSRSGASAPSRLIAYREEIRPENITGDLKGMVELGKDAAVVLRHVNVTQEQLRDFHTQLSELSRLYTADTMHLSLVIDSMEEEIKRLRMQPFSTITTPFARMVRDLARQSGKEAVLTILGGDTEVDKRILEGIKDPLTHILRNAIDHGIEKPDKRQALGKARTGQITLSAEQNGKEILIRVSDDGTGLDIEAIRQAVTRMPSAQRSGRDPRTMTESELIDSMFFLGISTSRMITDVSGRGVGLNVVRNNIEDLHGRIDVDWRLGEGTVFTLVLPLALTGTRGLLVRSAGQLFAIPINNVERTLSLQPGDIFTVEGHDAIQYGDHPVTLVRLNEVLELEEKTKPGMDNGKELSAIILAVGDLLSSQQGAVRQARQVAFIIEELAGEQEIVIKDLGKQLSRVGGISGATVLGSGEVVLVLNAADLMKLTVRRSSRSILETLTDQSGLETQTERKTILVVDDSITTRTLEKNILEAAGYNVTIATDGYEALGILRSAEKPNLVVTDIVMPRMDGFELTRQIKTDAQLSSLPVILVTSLDSAEDKERGIEVEADAYIVKSSFDQVNLLETIRQLI
jgi:two-component system chemotaxis sensor kinase CheA